MEDYFNEDIQLRLREKENKKGVHSKNKNSISKAAKFYKKKYRGQGR